MFVTRHLTTVDYLLDENTLYAMGTVHLIKMYIWIYLDSSHVRYNPVHFGF